MSIFVETFRFLYRRAKKMGEAGFSPVQTDLLSTPPARGSDYLEIAIGRLKTISIHAFRKGGDSALRPITREQVKFLSAPSKRGATPEKRFFHHPGAKIAQGDRRCTVVMQLPRSGLHLPACQRCGRTRGYYKAGETVDVTLQRADNGKYAGQTVSVTLGSAKEMPQAAAASSAAESSDA